MLPSPRTMYRLQRATSYQSAVRPKAGGDSVGLMKSCAAPNNIWTPSAARPGLLVCSARPAATPLTADSCRLMSRCCWLPLEAGSLISPAQVPGSTLPSLPSLPLALRLPDSHRGPAVVLCAAAHLNLRVEFCRLRRRWPWHGHAFLSSHRAATTTQ